MGIGKYGKEEMEEKGKMKKIIDNYYLLRIILNKRFSFHIHFFHFRYTVYRYI